MYTFGLLTSCRLRRYAGNGDSEHALVGDFDVSIDETGSVMRATFADPHPLVELRPTYGGWS